MITLKKATSLLSAHLLLFTSVTYANDSLSLKSLNVKEIVLPSEVTKLRKLSGSVYYSKSSKGKVLIPVNYWGKVAQAGLHFIPAETTFINGLSLAGGPSVNSKLDNVRLVRKKGEKITVKEFNLTEGGTADAYNFKLQPNDTIFVEENQFFQNRTYYTGLISIFATLLTSFVVFNQVKDD